MLWLVGSKARQIADFEAHHKHHNTDPRMVLADKLDHPELFPDVTEEQVKEALNSFVLDKAREIWEKMDRNNKIDNMLGEWEALHKRVESAEAEEGALRRIREPQEAENQNLREQLFAAKTFITLLAEQWRTDEQEIPGDGDFEEAWDSIVNDARTMLKSITKEPVEGNTLRQRVQALANEWRVAHPLYYSHELDKLLED